MGICRIEGLVVRLEAEDSAVPALARPALRGLAGQIADCTARIDAIEKDITARHKANEIVPGIGALIASAIAATVPDPSAFKSGRDFAAWLGLVPRQNSSGGKNRLGHITKTGGRYLRQLLVHGATVVIQHAGKKGAPG